MDNLMKRIYFLAMMFLSLYAKAQNTFNEIDYQSSRTVFTLNAPTQPKLRIYASADAKSATKQVKMQKVGENRWETTVQGDLKGKFYTFDVGKGECPGVFAKAVGVNGKRGAIIDMAETNPEGWEKDKRPKLKAATDQVIYEVHMRDYSIDASGGFQHKGKYLSWTEPKALQHLKKLGVTAVHFQPLYDYASVDETKMDVAQFNWGYDPLNYNVPEGYYATDAQSPATRIKEFKQMIQAFHKAGIRVIFDAVYNHCNDVENSNFHRTYPGYYYRMAEDGKGVSRGIEQTAGNYSNGSGCGNETASEKPLMRQFMIESVLYWIKEYHIDGWRFDLMGIHDIETMNMIRKEVDEIDPSIFMYGEGWSCGPCAYPTEKLAIKIHTPQLDRIAAFDDDMRDALRGPFTDDHQGGFVAGIPGNEERVKFGIAGCGNHPQVDLTKANGDHCAWAPSPVQAIHYVSCHDDMCLVDRLRASVPGITQEELIRLDLLAQTAVFTAQGVPFMLGGEEMLRDKKGTHNSYNSPDSINHLDWDNLNRYPTVQKYYQGLMKLRKNHPAFRLTTAEEVRKHLEFLPVEGDCLIAYRLKEYAGRDNWRNIIVILNSNKAPRTVSIPEGSYTIVCHSGQIDLKGISSFTGSKVEVPAQSAVIIHD